jgi:hypothetical protein
MKQKHTEFYFHVLADGLNVICVRFETKLFEQLPYCDLNAPQHPTA